jgi:ABC-type multidrug transport system ATPase subunit
LIVLAVDSIGKSFGARRVLTAASVWVQSGRISALLGRNGCGKSTLLKIAAGVLPADHGIIRFQGRTYTRTRLHRMARAGLCYLPERGLLAPLTTVRRHLQLVEGRFGVSGKDEVLDRLNLRHLLDATPEQLSTGEKRRAEVALAFLRRPNCLLADEPFMGIAPLDIDLIAECLHTLAAHGCAILVTGHEVRALLDVSDDVIWMSAGTTHALGAPALALENHSFRRDYIGPRGALSLEPWTPETASKRAESGWR